MIRFLTVAIVAGLSFSPAVAETPIRVLAAQGFYAEVAKAVGGDRVTVETIAMPSGVDPHDFEPSPSVARAVADAAVVIFNGAHYDHWMEDLLASTERPDRKAIEVAGLIGVADGGNPHVWYDPATMPALAAALTATFSELDAEAAADYAARRVAYEESLAALAGKVATLKARFAGTAIAATEPVFGPMAAALGLSETNPDFQAAIMNETEPSARDVAATIETIESGKAKALIYNEQVTDPMTEQLLAAARAANVPVVGVTETAPDGTPYNDWMIGELDALEKALAGQSS